MIDSLFKAFKKEDSFGRDKALSAKNISNNYYGKKFLDNISFNVYNGEVFSVIGLSGSGKSTLLKSIIGLISHSGDIRFFGKHPFFSKQLIGYCPQDDSFIPDLTIMENIELFSKISGTKKDFGIKNGLEFLKKFRIEKHKDDYPSKLSGGQKKRLNIVLSCLHLPKLLILDEPFAALDYLNRRLLWDFLIDLKNMGSSIILTTHLLNETQEYSSRMLILKNGKKFAYGTFSDIKEKIKFSILFHAKFDRLSKSFYNELKSFCDFKKIRIVYAYKREVQFALSGLAQKETLINFFKKNNQNFSEISASEPSLDELMLVSA